MNRTSGRRSIGCEAAGLPVVVHIKCAHLRRPVAARGCADHACERQLGHKDPSITLRVYACWILDASGMKAVDLLDDAQSSAPLTKPPSIGA
jgi:hypothetical protein